MCQCHSTRARARPSTAAEGQLLTVAGVNLSSACLANGMCARPVGPTSLQGSLLASEEPTGLSPSGQPPSQRGAAAAGLWLPGSCGGSSPSGGCNTRQGQLRPHALGSPGRSSGRNHWDRQERELPWCGPGPTCYMQQDAAWSPALWYRLTPSGHVESLQRFYPKQRPPPPRTGRATPQTHCWQTGAPFLRLSFPHCKTRITTMPLWEGLGSLPVNWAV